MQLITGGYPQHATSRACPVCPWPRPTSAQSSSRPQPKATRVSESTFTCLSVVFGTWPGMNKAADRHCAVLLRRTADGCLPSTLMGCDSLRCKLVMRLELCPLQRPCRCHATHAKRPTRQDLVIRPQVDPFAMHVRAMGNRHVGSGRAPAAVRQRLQVHPCLLCLPPCCACHPDPEACYCAGPTLPLRPDWQAERTEPVTLDLPTTGALTLCSQSEPTHK